MTGAISFHTCVLVTNQGKLRATAGCQYRSHEGSPGQCCMLYAVGRCPAGKWCGVPMTLEPCCNVLLAHVSLQHSTSLMAFAKTRSWQESRCALSLSLCAQCSFPVGCTTNSQKICLVFVLPCMLGKTLQEHFFYKKMSLSDLALCNLTTNITLWYSLNIAVSD